MDADGFEERDRTAARNFLTAAQHNGVERIIYLSGLGRSGDQLSTHLKSRHEVGEILASGHIPVTELRAAIVVGSGSSAFDMLRYLTERLPAMIAPRWLATRIQPIAEDDLVAYLIAAGAESEPGGVVEIGGAEVVTYRQMIEGYAGLRRLRRVVVGIPLLTPSLSSYWVRLMTPVPTSVSRPLIDGLRNEVVVTNDDARERYPNVEPIGYVAGAAAALDRQSELVLGEMARRPDRSRLPGGLVGDRDRRALRLGPSSADEDPRRGVARVPGPPPRGPVGARSDRGLPSPRARGSAVLVGAVALPPPHLRAHGPKAGGQGPSGKTS